MMKRILTLALAAVLALAVAVLHRDRAPGEGLAVGLCQWALPLGFACPPLLIKATREGPNID